MSSVARAVALVTAAVLSTSLVSCSVAPAAAPAPQESSPPVPNPSESFVIDVNDALVGEPVDLGLSVRWSSINVGASTPEEYGDLVGWGDVTGQNRSENSDEYPSADPPADISGTEYDIASSRWGDGWRLPTAAEFQELIDQTQWKQSTSDGGWGYEFVGSTGNSIFLPAVGGRIGEDLNYQGNGADYWSGTLSSTGTTARYLFFYSPLNEEPQLGDFPRHYGFAVRPVIE